MNAKLTQLDNKVADTLTFFHAPSITAALRASAEQVASGMSALCMDNVEGGLVAYVAGDVDMDVQRVGDTCYEVLFFASGVKFARAIVNQ